MYVFSFNYFVEKNCILSSMVTAFSIKQTVFQATFKTVFNLSTIFEHLFCKNLSR